MIDRAILIQERVYGPDHHLLSASWLIKAKICREKGDRAQAEIFIKKALTAAEETGNKSALAKFQKEAKDIRTNKQVAYFPMAQSNE